MDDTTPNLGLPYIMAAQAQKHVTHNEAIRALDAIVQIGVLDRNLASPPASPAEGARYIVAAGGTGPWQGGDGSIAAWQDGAWALYQPRAGWVAYVADEAALVTYSGSDWQAVGSAALNPAPLVGINATADATNRLAISAPASLFNHEGAGHQQKINKAAAAQTASQLYQTNFSGRAEIGLTGDDNFHFKVSPNGSTWNEGLVLDRNTGIPSFPRGFDSTQVVVQLDTVGAVPTPTPGGLVILTLVHPTFPQAQVAGMFSYDTGQTPALVSLILGDAMTNLGTTVPTATTGPVGKVNLAVNNAGQLLIENRYNLASPRQFCVTFFGGFRAL